MTSPAVGGDYITQDEFKEQVARLGREAGPKLLQERWTSGVMHASTLAAVIGAVWSMAEFPDDPERDRSLSHDAWRDLFDAAGFTVGGRSTERPSEALRVYRGAVWERRRLWSWTTDLQVAQAFTGNCLRRHVKDGVPAQSEVWTTLASARSLLARNTTDNARDESEVVVDTHRLRIFRHEAK